MDSRAVGDVVEPREFGQEQAFVVHLVGGGCINMMLLAHDLTDVQDDMNRRRALIGRHVYQSAHGCEGSSPALIPSNRIQMVILDEH